MRHQAPLAGRLQIVAPCGHPGFTACETGMFASPEDIACAQNHLGVCGTQKPNPHLSHATRSKPSTLMGHCPIHQAFGESVGGVVLPPCTLLDPRLQIHLGPSMAINLSGACGRGADPWRHLLHDRIVDFLGHCLVGSPFSLGVFHQDASDVYRSSPLPFPGMLLHVVRASKTPDGGTLPIMLKPTAAMSATLTSE